MRTVASQRASELGPRDPVARRTCAVEPPQRIALINRCAETLQSRGYREIDFILGQFSLPWTDHWDGRGGTEYDYVRDMLAGAHVDSAALIVWVPNTRSWLLRRHFGTR
jgi:hypothetical protein